MVKTNLRIDRERDYVLDLDTGKLKLECITWISGIPHVHGGPSMESHDPLAYVNIKPGIGAYVRRDQLGQDFGLFEFSERFPDWRYGLESIEY